MTKEEEPILRKLTAI